MRPNHISISFPIPSKPSSFIFTRMYMRSTRCTKAPSNLYGSVFLRTSSTTGNALTCAARLGLKPKLISKVANGAQGKSILEELEADGVDTSFIVRGILLLCGTLEQQLNLQRTGMDLIKLYFGTDVSKTANVTEVSASEAHVQSTEVRQHVTYPKHFHVPEGLKGSLTFGSFNTFGPSERSCSDSKIDTGNMAHNGIPSGSFMTPPVGYAPSVTMSSFGNENFLHNISHQRHHLTGRYGRQYVRKRKKEKERE